MLGLLGTLLPGLFKIGNKMIVDQDKKMEYAFKVQEFTFKMMEVMLNTKTYPWVDALVKLSYAGEQIIKGLLRPIGAMAMFAYAAYCNVNGIELNEMIQATLYGAPVAWGASRHAEKKRKEKEPEWGED